MTLTVEDGGAKPGATSYASVSDADTYIADWHEDAAWNTANTSRKERALRNGTRFVDAHRFRGWRLSQSQALDWPRDGVGLVDGQDVYPGTIPDAIKRAAIEAALRDVRGEALFPDHDGGTLKRESKQVGDLRKEQEFDRPRQAGKTFEAIRALLRPYLQSSGSRQLSRSFG
jgi:hypothetical protein